MRQEVDGHHTKLLFYGHNHARQYTESIELTLTKKIHRLYHETISEMRLILEDSGRWFTKMEKSCISVGARCEACPGSGRRSDRSHISLRNVNDAFNNKAQADFIVVNIRNVIDYVVNMTCCSTNLGIHMIVSNQTAKTMRNELERYWIYYFGAPKQFSADSEFTRGIMQRFLQLHKIRKCQRPSRSSTKNGLVERQNEVFKIVIDRIERHKTAL